MAVICLVGSVGILSAMFAFPRAWHGEALFWVALAAYFAWLPFRKGRGSRNGT